MASQLARRNCQTFSTGFTPDLIRGGTVGGKGQKGDVVGHGQGFAAVPTRPVEDQHGVSARRHRACDFGKMGVHRGGVDERKDETGGCAAARADRAEQVGPFVSGVAWGPGSAAALRPDPGERALLADARVRHVPRTDGGTMAHSWNHISTGFPRAAAGIAAATVSRNSF